MGCKRGRGRQGCKGGEWGVREGGGGEWGVREGEAQRQRTLLASPH